MNRNRLYYGLMILTVIISGLFSRLSVDWLPLWLNTVLGDALWAVMIYLMTAFIFKNRSILNITFFSLCFCYFIEVSQLYQGEWILAIRNTTLGGLVLGHGFLWSDILAYTLGVGIAAFSERILIKGD